MKKKIVQVDCEYYDLELYFQKKNICIYKKKKNSLLKAECTLTCMCMCVCDNFICSLLIFENQNYFHPANDFLYTYIFYYIIDNLIIRLTKKKIIIVNTILII